MQVDMTLDQMVSSNWGASARPEVLGRPAAAAGLVLPCSQGHARLCHQKPAASHCLQTRTACGMSCSHPLQVGWVQSWSAYAPYCWEHGAEAAQQLLERYRSGLAAALRLTDGRTAVPTRWPLHLLLARQPLPLQDAAGQ